jgi:hypothetical protein
MYCPSCATPIDGNQKFCRACGANVSLVPQALTGQLPVLTAADEEETTWQGKKRKRRKPPTIERAVGKFFSGIGFIIAALFVTFWFPGGAVWGWTLLFPAWGLIGEGVGQYFKVKELERQRERLLARPVPQIHLPSAAAQQPRAPEFSAPTTSELINPSSVTEQTTRHLGQS